MQGGADIILLTRSEKSKAPLEGFKGNYVIFETPGEYASHGITIKGIASFRDSEGGTLRGQNTFYTLNIEDINICFLGALGHILTPEQLDHLGPVDILFIPVGGISTLPVPLVDELIHKIEPALVIPMHYKLDSFSTDMSDIKDFCSEIGNCPEQSLVKLNVKKKDLEGKSMEVVLFEKS